MQGKNKVRKEKILKDLLPQKLTCNEGARQVRWRDLLKFTLIPILIIIAAMASPNQLNAASLRLTWEEDSTLDGFKIERATNSNYAEIARIGPDGRSYIDSGLIGGTMYCYRMKAFNSVGDSAYSDEVCATALGGGTPTVPGAAILVSPSETITTTPTYTWYAAPRATWYYLLVSEDDTARPFTQWFSASEAGCASGEGTCSVTANSSPIPFRVAVWGILGWNPNGFGPWSTVMAFTLKP